MSPTGVLQRASGKVDQHGEEETDMTAPPFFNSKQLKENGARENGRLFLSQFILITQITRLLRPCINFLHFLFHELRIYPCKRPYGGEKGRNIKLK